MRIRFLGLYSLLLLLLSFSLSAQTRDSVTIEVVDVPVFVTKNVTPVEGLTRDDFELYVNGKPQPIDYFDIVQANGASEDESSPQSLRERRLFLLMIDVAFSNPHAVRRAQNAAAELVANAPESDLFAIATFSSRRGVWFATPFTRDRITLARGIASLSASDSGDPLSIVLSAAERAAIGDWLTNAPERSDYFFRDALLDRITGEALRDIWTMQVRRAVEHQLQDFKDLAGRLSTLQGQKHVVVLSEGYEMASSPMRSGDIRRVSFAVDDVTGYPAMPPGINLIGGSVFRYLDDMRKAFQANDILLHTLDLRGVSSLLDSNSLFVLANETGGKFVHNRNDFGKGLLALSKSYSYGYLLGFKPSANVKAGHNKIEVKVKGLDRNAQVRYRKGFSGTPRPFDVHEGLYLADVILNDVPQTGTAAALKLDEGMLEVRVPLQPLAAQLGKTGTAELLVYAFDAEGTALAFHKRVVDVPADSTGETIFELNLPAGVTVAKALLRVDDSVGFSKTGA